MIIVTKYVLDNFLMYFIYLFLLFIFNSNQATEHWETN